MKLTIINNIKEFKDAIKKKTYNRILFLFRKI